jgi:hypothetical protein
MLPLEGWTFVTMNMVEFGPRLDAEASVHPSGASLIELPEAIVPEIRGVSVLLPRAEEAMHRIETRPRRGRASGRFPS